MSATTKSYTQTSNLPAALRLFRVFHDLSVTELANLLQVSPGYVSLLEGGKKAPNLKLIVRYAKVFETSPSAILSFAEALGGDIERVRARRIAGMRAKFSRFVVAVQNGLPVSRGRMRDAAN